MTVIAMTREMGSRGKDVSLGLASRFGLEIIRRAIEEPMRQIAENSGIEGSIVVNRVRAGQGDFGYNAATDEYGALFAMGVIDPVKVVRAALQNAASVAGLMLATDCMIAEQRLDATPAH